VIFSLGQWRICTPLKNAFDIDHETPYPFTEHNSEKVLIMLWTDFHTAIKKALEGSSAFCIACTAVARIVFEVLDAKKLHPEYKVVKPLAKPPANVAITDFPPANEAGRILANRDWDAHLVVVCQGVLIDLTVPQGIYTDYNSSDDIVRFDLGDYSVAYRIYHGNDTYKLTPEFIPRLPVATFERLTVIIDGLKQTFKD